MQDEQTQQLKTAAQKVIKDLNEFLSLINQMELYQKIENGRAPKEPTLEEQVLAAVTNYVNFNFNSIPREFDLNETFGVIGCRDGLDLCEVAMEVEEKLGIEIIPDEYFDTTDLNQPINNLVVAVRKMRRTYEEEVAEEGLLN